MGIMSGCSSIINGTHQSISVLTPPTDHARCSLRNDKGTWFINRTPGSVVVHRSFNDLHVICEKKGFEKNTVSIKSKTKGMAFGNILVGGVIGAGIDVANGSAYDYPQSIIVPLKPKK